MYKLKGDEERRSQKVIFRDFTDILFFFKDYVISY